MTEEFKLVWLENLLDTEKIIDLMETCDKQCSKCTKEQKNDCLLEMRESIHSLAIHFKSAILSFVELTNGIESQQSIEQKPEPQEKASLYT
ncbi:MAG TPA: hypothetical protein VKM55_11340 [Candidatus Lokiarchaeia archaeon]|nr:hypothetical protein [Candidatus Lokiarchaeia archaeon]